MNETQSLNNEEKEKIRTIVVNAVENLCLMVHIK